jgi:ferrous iron transport protein B
MGNPNVGKSVIFNRLTGVNVIASNYPGTTVDFAKGNMRIKGKKFEVIDVPGTYSLDPTSEAEKIAVRLLDELAKGDIVVDIIDSTNLERSLNLTLHLIKHRIPMVVALNLWDETKHIGIEIDARMLEETIGIPCIPTCAITGEGIKTLVDRMTEARTSTYDYEEGEKWHEVGNIVNKVQKITHRHHRFLERLQDASVRPITGIPIALLVLLATFEIIRFIGEGLIGYVF